LALVLAADELASGEVTVKHLREDRPQESLPREKLAGWLSERLA